jgi:hypothetical protein
MASSGIQDERVWPETQELCDSVEDFIPNREQYGPVPGERDLIMRSYELHNAPRSQSFAPMNHDGDSNHVPEGGYISEYHADLLDSWYAV